MTDHAIKHKHPYCTGKDVVEEQLEARGYNQILSDFCIIPKRAGNVLLL